VNAFRHASQSLLISRVSGAQFCKTVDTGSAACRGAKKLFTTGMKGKERKERNERDCMHKKKIKGKKKKLE
jgi:hypothetical protein